MHLSHPNTKETVMPQSLTHLTRKALFTAALAGVALGTAGAAIASSHREAPMITQYPKVDGTDLYVFNSYEPGREGYVVILANYVPLQDAYGGPNYFAMDPDALYEIHIDNNGDAKEDLTFSFKFTTMSQNIALNVGGKSVAIPLINAGPITNRGDGNINTLQTYSIDLIKGARRDPASPKSSVTPALAGDIFIKPTDNIGNKSIPSYEPYAAQHIRGLNIPGCTPPAGTYPRVFVGQRKEGFQVNLGEIFDLVNIPTAKVIGPRDGSSSATEDKNVTTVALEIPASCLTAGSDPVIGVWTTASLPPGKVNLPASAGSYVQVSRLGAPLVNELVIGLKDKDKFNMSEPKDDGQFADYVTNPTLPALLALLYADAGVQAPNVYPRADLVAAFLTGVPGVNQQKTVTASEMLRLNTAIPATAKAKQNSLGALQCFVNGALTVSNAGCDPAGFPNGRRPGDDVVDIELRVAMGALLASGPGVPSSAGLPYTDGVLVEASQFDQVFPFLTPPFPGSPNGANGLDANKSRKVD
jgi:hypothetical protein